MDYENETFTGGTISLDGNTYRNCTLQNCVLKYAGGPLTLVDCKLDMFTFVFDGDLARGLDSLHQLFGTEGMLQIIRGFTVPPTGEIIELAPPR